MSTLRRWVARLLGTFVTRRSERQLAEELEAHLQLEIDDLVRRGMTEREARRQALIRSGGVEVAKEAYREQRGFPVLDHLRRDVIYTFRMVRRNPGFTGVVVSSVALAIGANTAVFSLADAVFLKRLPVPEPQELLLFEWVGAESSWRDVSYSGSARRSDVPGELVGTSFPLTLVEAVGASNTTLSGLFAFAEIEQVNVVDAEAADIARGELVTGEYYRTLGVPAAFGRTIVPEDDRAAAEPVAVLSHAYWQSRFGADPSVLGRTLRMNGVAVTVVGVTPPGFTGTLDVGRLADVTFPMAMAPRVAPGEITEADLGDAGEWWVQLMGRRRSDVTREEVEAELAVVFARVLRPVDNAGATTDAGSQVMRPRIVSGARGPHDERRDYRLVTALLSGLSALFLLLSCTNVASLLLSRASARRGEITMRLALGAGRRRVVGQLLVEALSVALIAEVLGLALAYWGKELLLVLRPVGSSLELRIDGRALLVATVLAASSALFFGLAPALHATRGTLGESIKSATGGRSGSRSWARSALLVVQISASVVLLFGSALFLGSLRNLRAAEVGFDPDRLLVFRVDPRLNRYEEERVPLLYRELQRAYEEIPGVEVVSFSRHALLTGGRRTLMVGVAGQAEEAAAPALMNPVGPDFFDTMRIPILMGRSLTARDDGRSPRVVVVNETFVRSRLAGQQPLGRLLRVGDQDWEIVGVAAEAKYYDVRADVQGTVYQPFLQTETGQGAFVLRAAGDPESLLPAVRDATRGVDPTLTLFDARTQRAAAEALFGEERVLATMTTALGALALFLAVIGIYGATSYATAQRTGEIGLRIALGSSGWGVLWLIARRTLALVVVGLGLGLGASMLGSGHFTRLLYGLTAADLRSMMLVVGGIGAAALAAAYVAASRATRISPLDALRHE